MKNNREIKRRIRVRAKLSGSKARPRLSVFRSGRQIYAQVIDDHAGKTLAAFSSLKLKSAEKKGKTKSEIAEMVGEKLSEIAKKTKIKKVVFDRGSYKFHGRVKALSTGAKKGGLEF